MLTITHFRTEFIRQSQAHILRRVTMTQFLLVIGVTAAGVGLLNLPYWLAPLCMAAGYVAGSTYQGELVWKRLLAYLVTWTRVAAGSPRLVNVQSAWEAVKK